MTVSGTRVVVIMGVSGSGKTTVGAALARAAGGVFHDADAFHSAESIDKMRRGIPLGEADREPWIAALRAAIDEWRERPELSVLACSALTARIRERLGVHRSGVGLVYLEGDAALIASRMRERRHFMAPELLDSQFALLEPPIDALALDAARPIDELVAEIRRAFAI